MRNNSFSTTHANEWQRGTEISGEQSLPNTHSAERFDSDLHINTAFSDDSQRDLILHHSQSGNLYYSKAPEKKTAEDTFDDTDLDLQLDTPTGAMPEHCFLRWLLTLLHAATCMVSGFCFVFSLFGTLFSDHCLPYLVNKDGTQIKSQFGFFGLCEATLFGLGFVFVVSLLMCGLVQCSLNKIPMVVFSLFLTTCMGACAMIGAAMFTVHYTLWCDSISQHLVPRHVRCEYAAASFDRLHRETNMTAFQTQMEIQQITAWTLFPLTFITLLCYALAMRWGQVPSAGEYVPPPRGFYQYLASRAGNDRETRRPNCRETDERSPFLHR